MGMGHVPTGPLRLLRTRRDFQGCQRRGAPREGALAIASGADPAGYQEPAELGSGTRSPGSTRRRALGASGEDRAARWYEAAGYEVLDRNWRCLDGELDLVVRRGSILVFCEVKTRTSRKYGEPFEAVTRSKQLRIRRLAGRWLRDRGDCLDRRPAGIRFDVVSVLGLHVETLEDAF